MLLSLQMSTRLTLVLYIIRDFEGFVNGCSCKLPTHDKFSPKIAEAMAMSASLSWAFGCLSKSSLCGVGHFSSNPTS